MTLKALTKSEYFDVNGPKNDCGGFISSNPIAVELKVIAKLAH